MAIANESVIARTPTPIPPPTTTNTEPPVTAVAFAVMSDFESISNGNPAESAARIKRLIPKAMRTTAVKATPVVPLKTKSATSNKLALRARFAKNNARWRETRSKMVPTNGPTIEYGNKTTAKPRAAFKAFAWRSGEKRTKEAKAL